MATTGKLVFVYAGDSGALNALFHVAHKIVSPSTYPCGLCALTHGIVAERSEWREFIRAQSLPAEFLHRDELRRRHPDATDALPAVFLEGASGLQPLLAAEEIRKCKTTAELIEAIRARLPAAR
jgi:hypothetical protein